MFRNNYFEDGRLDIVILGPMGNENNQDSTSLIIKNAVEELLLEEKAHKFLVETQTKTTHVHIPEDWQDGEIIKGILTRVDIADLVIVNLTPKDGPESPASPNVFYELGLVHALGLPVISLAQSGTDIPFYALTNRALFLKEITAEEVKNKLRTPLFTFLNPKDFTNFSDNRISQFYGGLPIIDISAAVGLATGYYYNFVGRLLTNGGIISQNKDKVERLIMVRPHNIMNSYDEEKDRLLEILNREGYTLEEERGLTIPPGDDKGGIWVYHVNGIIIDLPRTIYPLKISPRLLSLQERSGMQSMVSGFSDEYKNHLHQLSERLLDRVQNAIRYHAQKDGERFRQGLLDFATMEQVPGLLRKYLT